MTAITIIDDCVLLPDPADWTSPPSWKLSWQTEEEIALRGNEGRNALRKSPVPESSWSIQPRTVEDAAMHQARLRAGFAAHAGRFCAPLHGRESYLAVAAGLGATSLVVEPTPWQWRQGDSLLVRDGVPGRYSTHHVASAFTDPATQAITLTVEPGLAFGLTAGEDVAPLFFGRMFNSEQAEIVTPDLASVPLRLTGDRFAISPDEPDCCVPPLPPFDFAVVRYRCPRSSGYNLVTQTAAISFSQEDVGYLRADQIPVGESQPNGYLYGGSTGATESQQPYLVYGGDTFNADSVLINLNRLVSDFGYGGVTIRMHAFFRDADGDGKITITLTTYRGGTMQGGCADAISRGVTPGDFTATGSVVREISAERTVTMGSAFNPDGQDLGSVVYDPTRRRLTIELPGVE